MRKDIRFGLAVGGVLVVVMAVYLVIAGFSNKPANTQQVHLVTTEGTPGHAENGASTATAGDNHATDQKAPTPNDGHGDALADTASAVHAAQPAANHSDATPARSNHDVWATALTTGRVLTTETPTPGASSDPSSASADNATPSPQTASPIQGASAVTLASATPAPGPQDSDMPSSSTIHTNSSSAASTPTPITGQQSHTVQAGETFSTIAASTYGNAAYWPHIARANPNIDSRRLKVGMVLVLPDPAVVKAGAKTQSAQTQSSSATTIDPAKEYRVQPNDSLYKISIKLYGNGTYVDRIYQMNQQTIGSNPAHLKLGMVLRLPEVPKHADAAR